MFLETEIEAAPWSCFAASDYVQAENSPLYLHRVLAPESDEVIARALQGDSVARRILAKGNTLVHGSLCGIRLNINVIKNTGVAVHSVHAATNSDGYQKGRGFYRGEVLTYLPVVTLRDCWFNVNQKGREAIAAGQMSKHPMASCDGTFTQVEACFDGVEVSFNPMRSHTFVDLENRAIECAQEVTILGHRIYARGRLKYFTHETAPIRIGGAVSCAVFG